jgi:aminoglycoside phosphotransferase (APT) family kinase protein
VSDIQTLLETLLAELTGGPVEVANAVRLSGGATRETWAFDVTVGRERDPLPAVFQSAVSEDLLFGEGRSLEFEVLQAAQRMGVPVPPPLWHSRLPDGRSFTITGRIEGEVLGSKVVKLESLRAARLRLPVQLAAALARIHSILPSQTDLDLRAPAPDELPSLSELRRFELAYRRCTPNPHPVIELALRWLASHLPPCPRISLVHGDFRVGNFIVTPAGLAAVLDWELAHWGDPLEDLGWMLVRSWRFGSPLQAGGLCTSEELIDAYERFAHSQVDRDAVEYWKVFGNLRWAILTIKQMSRHLLGQEKSMELASLGRRTAEAEWELLNLIETRPD